MSLLCSIWLGLACSSQIASSPADQARLRAYEEQEAWMKKSAAEWMTMLDRSDAVTRRARVGLYNGRGTSDKSRLRPVFVRAMNDPDAVVRLEAAGVVLLNPGFVEAETTRAVEILGQALGDPKALSRAIHLLQYGPERSIPVLPKLARSLGLIEDEANDWRFVTEIFRSLGEKASPAVGALAEVLKSGDARAKARSATLLTSVGAPARTAVPALLEALRAPERDVVIAAHEALRRIDPASLPRPSPVLRFLPGEIAILQGPDLVAGYHAVERLSRIGPDAVGTMPEIVRFSVRWLKNPDPTGWSPIFITSLVAREKFGDGLIPALLAEIRDDRGEVAVAACIFLSYGKAENADAIPAMIEKLGMTSGSLKGFVADAIGSIGRDDPRSIPVLIQAAKDPDAQVRAGAVSGMQCLENPTPEVIASAEAAMNDTDPKVRDQAELAVRLMKGAQSIRKVENAASKK